MAVCSGAIASLVTALMLASGDVTVIGTEAPFPPYTLIDEETGQISGFDRDVADEVCQRAMLICEWQAAQFDQLIPGVRDGRFDIVMGGIAKSAERREIVDFTIDYTVADGSDDFVGRAGAPEPDDALIGVQAGTIQHQHLINTGRNFVTYGNERALLEALIAGKIDLAFGAFDTDSSTDYFAANGIEWLYEENAGENGIGMAVCKGNTALLTKLDTALSAMQEDGTLDRLYDKWF